MAVSINSLEEDARYLEAARHIQQGTWDAALKVLLKLVQEYPDQQEELLPLLEHVQAKVRERQAERSTPQRAQVPTASPPPMAHRTTRNGSLSGHTRITAESEPAPGAAMGELMDEAEDNVHGALTLEEDARYQEAVRAIQQGKWDVALKRLQECLQSYPHQRTELLSLIEYVETEAKWHPRRDRALSDSEKTEYGDRAEDSRPEQPDADPAFLSSTAPEQVREIAPRSPGQAAYTSSLDDPRYREAARYVQARDWETALPLLLALQQEYPDQQGDILPLIEHVRYRATYHQAERHAQQGSWDAALQTLQKLEEEYPQHRQEFQPLLERVQMQAALDEKPVRGRSRLSILLFNRQRLIRLATVLFVVLLGSGFWYSYRTWIDPARQAQLQRAQLARTLDQAKEALTQAQYRQAAALFEKVLDQDGDNEDALAGLRVAQEQLEVIDQYQQAVELMSQGQNEAALVLFERLRIRSPGYKDVDRRIQRILATQEMDRLFAQAEQAYAEERWADAILRYNTVRQGSADYQRATVEQHLYESYVRLATERSKVAGLSNQEIEGIIDLYQGALSVRPAASRVRFSQQALVQYLYARSLSQQGQHGEAVALLAAVYSANPNLLGGDVARALYDYRLAYGKALEQDGNLWGAWEQYEAASRLPVDQNQKARWLAKVVAIALTPTVTPMPTPTLTPTPDAFQEFLKELPPTPVPPAPLEQFQGWIVFRSDRPGSHTGLWVMRPDGSEQQPVYDSTGLYNHLEEQARWSQDNMRRIWVEGDKRGGAVNIYMWRYDIPQNWLRDVRVELLNNSGINYQPVFSPDDQHIAFTSQRNNALFFGDDIWGDEIFILHMAEAKGGGQTVAYRLTFNDWEWDKHPTFSLDGQIIAFWSNRETGRAQIWAMNSDGSNQRNLSNNEWNDWDPIFVAPPRELPNLRALHGESVPVGPLFDPSKLGSGQTTNE